MKVCLIKHQWKIVRKKSECSEVESSEEYYSSQDESDEQTSLTNTSSKRCSSKHCSIPIRVEAVNDESLKGSDFPHSVSRDTLAKNMFGTCSGKNDNETETKRYSETKLEMGGLQSVPQMSFLSNSQNNARFYEKRINIIYCSFKIKHPFICSINDDSVSARANEIEACINVSFSLYYHLQKHLPPLDKHKWKIISTTGKGTTPLELAQTTENIDYAFVFPVLLLGFFLYCRLVWC